MKLSRKYIRKQHKFLENYIKSGDDEITDTLKKYNHIKEIF